MDIHLNNNVIVLDEAHNIEDSAREAASCTLTQDEILEARNDLEKMAASELNEHECTELVSLNFCEKKKHRLVLTSFPCNTISRVILLLSVFNTYTGN